MGQVTGLGDSRKNGRLAAPPAETYIGPEWDSPGVLPMKGTRGGLGKGSSRKGP